MTVTERIDIDLTDDERMLLCQGLNEYGGPIRNQLNVNVFPPFRDTFDIVPAALGEEVVVHGALALALDATLGRRSDRGADAAPGRSIPRSS